MINSMTAAVHKYLYGSCFLVVIFREVFFVSEGPENFQLWYRKKYDTLTSWLFTAVQRISPSGADALIL